MIFRRPSLTCVCFLLALPVGAINARADTGSPAGHASNQPQPPPERAALPAPGPIVSESGPVKTVAEAPGYPAVETAAPVPAASATPPEKTGEPEAAQAGLAERFEAPKPARPPTSPAQWPETNHEEIIGLQNLGVSLTERGDFDAAEIAFRQIMASRRATGDDLAHALLGLARCFRKQGTLTKAAAIYERYLKDYPADNQVPDALLELGRTHRALGAHQLALSRFYSVINSTLKLSSEGFEHYQMLAKTAQFEIAETHFQLGEFAEANKFFSRLRLLDLAPADRARAHFKSAYALYLGNDFEGAVSTLHSYLEQWPLDENVPEARYLLSLSLRTLGHKQEALEATLELLRSQQATGDAKRWAYWQRRTGNQLANDFFQNGDTHSALLIYQGLAALSSEPAWNLPITYQIGLCYERMRITERAMAAYQTIIDTANPPAVAPAPAPKTGPEEKSAPGLAALKPLSPELTELARMATWRLAQLAWHDQTERQLTNIFSTKPAPAKPSPIPANAVAPNIDSPAAGPEPVERVAPAPVAANTSLNDHPGNPATAPASL